MGATAALHVVLVGNPIHIDCTRSKLSHGLRVNSHAQNTHLYFQNRAHICWIFTRDIMVYEYLLIRPGQIKKYF